MQPYGLGGSKYCRDIRCSTFSGRVPNFLPVASLMFICLYIDKSRESFYMNATIHRPWPTLTSPTEWQAAMALQRVTEGLRLRKAACWGQP